MSDQPLNSNQRREVEQLAELQTRRYFDHYLQEVFPQQQKALREHTHLMIEKHDASDTAHGRIEQRFNRVVWIAAGVGLAAGASGVGLVRLALSILT